MDNSRKKRVGPFSEDGYLFLKELSEFGQVR